jgi:hypothetical protein
LGIPPCRKPPAHTAGTRRMAVAMPDVMECACCQTASQPASTWSSSA